MPTIADLKRLAEVEFADIVADTFFIAYKLRLVLVDNSFIDVNISKKIPDKFGFHWECRDTAGTIYRYDNFPDSNWKNIATFPYHFHKGAQENVEAAPFPQTGIDVLRSFLEFVRNELKE